LYYKPGKFLYNEFVLQDSWNQTMQGEKRKRRDLTKSVKNLETDLKQILSIIRH